MNDGEDQSDRTPVDVPVAEQHPQEVDTQRSARVSRRGFLTTSSVALASGGLATLGAAAVTGVAAAPPLQSATPAAAGTPEQSAEDADVGRWAAPASGTR